MRNPLIVFFAFAVSSVFAGSFEIRERTSPAIFDSLKNSIGASFTPNAPDEFVKLKVGSFAMFGKNDKISLIDYGQEKPFRVTVPDYTEFSDVMDPWLVKSPDGKLGLLIAALLIETKACPGRPVYMVDMKSFKGGNWFTYVKGFKSFSDVLIGFNGISSYFIIRNDNTLEGWSVKGMKLEWKLKEKKFMSMAMIPNSDFGVMIVNPKEGCRAFKVIQVSTGKVAYESEKVKDCSEMHVVMDGINNRIIVYTPTRLMLISATTYKVEKEFPMPAYYGKEGYFLDNNRFMYFNGRTKKTLVDLADGKVTEWFERNTEGTHTIFVKKDDTAYESNADLTILAHENYMLIVNGSNGKYCYFGYTDDLANYFYFDRNGKPESISKDSPDFDPHILSNAMSEKGRFQLVELLNKQNSRFISTMVLRAGEPFSSAMENKIVTMLEKNPLGWMVDKPETKDENKKPDVTVAGKTCSSCSGSGLVGSGTKVTCRSCNGSGGSSCGRCGGSGWIGVTSSNGKSSSHNCSACGGSGKIKCHMCYGSGSVTSNGTSCRYCGGTGIMK